MDCVLKNRVNQKKNQSLGGLSRSRKKTDINELFNLQDVQIKELKNKCKNLIDVVEKYEDQILSVEVEKERLMNQFQYDKLILINEMNRMKTEKEIVSKKVNVINSLGELPKDLISVVNLMEKVQSDKLVFLPKSKISSKESKYQDVCSSWSLLWNMSTVLWNMVFKETLDRTTIEKEFKNRTSFELSFREGRMTNRDNKCHTLRTREYNGSIIDITPHCKIDKSKGQLRVHFYLDFQKEKIVIGHCGDHLENYSSLRN